MKCRLCVRELPVSADKFVRCLSCDSLSKATPALVKNPPVLGEGAGFHFNLFRSSALSGVVPISVPASKCQLLDVGGSMPNALELSKGKLAAYTVANLPGLNIPETPKAEFIFVNDSLQRVPDAASFLKALKPKLRNGGFIQLVVYLENQVELSNNTDYNTIPSMPALYEMFTLQGYRVLDRLTRDTGKSHVLCIQ